MAAPAFLVVVAAPLLLLAACKKPAPPASETASSAPSAPRVDSRAPAGPAPKPAAPAPVPAPRALAPEPDTDAEARRMIRGFLRAALHSRARIVEIICDEWGEEEDLDPAAVEAFVDAEIAAKAADERTWPAVLDCERLDRAFEALRKDGFVCLHNAGYDQSDGFHECEEARERLGGDASKLDGYCFYTEQDAEGAVGLGFVRGDGGSLMLAFGSFAEREGTVETGKRIVARLEEAGLATSWDGTIKRRIELKPFDYRRRGVPADDEDDADDD